MVRRTEKGVRRREQLVRRTEKVLRRTEIVLWGHRSICMFAIVGLLHINVCKTEKKKSFMYNSIESLL